MIECDGRVRVRRDRGENRGLAARAFTLLELMLAVVLGALVLATTLGVFMALQRSDRHNQRQLQAAVELSTAHRACELAMRTLILSPTRPPVQPVDPAAPRPGVAPPAPEPAEFEVPRLVLSRDGTGRAMRWIDGSGRVEEFEPQRLEITIERPPVFATPEPGEAFVPVVHRMYASRRAREREERREEREAERQTGRDEENEAPPEDLVVASGVRGVFEVTFEPDDARRAREMPSPDGGSWSLWWRTLPPLVEIPGSERTEGLSIDELRRNPMYRPVKLASNLRWCRWEAVRLGETVMEFESTWWEDLPAYVTLEIQTVGGKWSKWMFEVQGTRGAEPGSFTSPGAAGEEGTTGTPIDRAIDGAIERMGRRSGSSASGALGVER